MAVDGIDVSKWQGVMNWPKAASAGAKYAFLRAGSIDSITQTCYVDSQFEANALGAKANLAYVGAYWYFRPFKALEQADFFVNLIYPHSFNLPPVIDVETDGGYTPTVVATAIRAFLARVELNIQRPPIIYTRAAWWNENVAAGNWNNWDLWIARYATLPQPWGSPGDPQGDAVVPRDWTTWKFWQWSADGNGMGPTYGATGSASIDLDRFNGTEAELAAYCGGNVPTQKILKVVVANGAVVRAQAGSGKYLRVEPVDALLVSTGETVANGLVWYDIGVGYVKATDVVVTV